MADTSARRKRPAKAKRPAPKQTVSITGGGGDACFGMPLRVQCVRLLERCAQVPAGLPLVLRADSEAHQRAAYCRALEREIYTRSISGGGGGGGGECSVALYREKVAQLAGALEQNAAFLLRAHSAARLATLDNAALAQHTAQEQQRVQCEQQLARCRALLHADTDIYADMPELATAAAGGPRDANSATASVLACCRYCRGTAVRFYSMQTRGADEGATIFCTCENADCARTWRYAG